MPDLFRFALASAPFPRSVEHGMQWVESFIEQAAENQASLVCFPESYIPGMRGIDEPVPPHSARALEAALAHAQGLARRWHTAVILPMDWDYSDGIQNVAMVISEKGELLGYQTKNQLDPSEDAIFCPGDKRQIFEVSGVTFGISICHEGFRYPESVRWAARHGASIVFHPHCTGSDKTGRCPIEWRGKGNGYYEHAMVCRAMENQIYFASINYAFAFQESATCVIAPNGDCAAYQPYGKPGLLTVEIDLKQATRGLALRYNASRYDSLC
jgi:predicted amidohydrolase